jgi:hypothetical protein
MCSPAACATCGKTTWQGCGINAELVVARVPEEERCACASVPAQLAAWYPRASRPGSE